VQARAHVSAVAADAGRTRLDRLRSEAPLVLRPSPRGVMLVAGAGGPLGGDDLHLDVDLGADARLDVASVAATIVQRGFSAPGRPSGPARFSIRADLGEDASLRWEPEPIVVCSGATLQVHTSVRCARGAALVWREILVLGRLGETGGTASLTMVVDVADRPVLRQTIWVGAAAPTGWDGAAGSGGHRVIGSMLLLGAAADALPRVEPDGATAVLTLEAGGLLVTALGDTSLNVRRRLDAVRSLRS